MEIIEVRNNEIASSNDFNYKAFFKNRERRLSLISHLSFIPDKLYLKLVYRIKTGRKLNLKNPVGFNEKEQWLKLHFIHPEYTNYVDKVAVREIVERMIGPGYFFPLFGTWNHFKDIDFGKLPDQFVLKCNHDSGSVKVITDKSKIDKDELSKFYEGRLKLNAFVFGREYPYKNIKPCIMAEKLMESRNGKGINDYKFFCFDGKPVIMFIATGRASGETKFDFFDMDFNHLDIVNIHPQSGEVIEKPECFDEMKEIAAKCSKGMKFVRIDLYEIDGKVYFGEFTFFHGGGFWPMHPDHWEKDLGDLIRI